MCASEYRINSNEQFINIGTNPKFEHLINNLTHNFTKLELTELTSLISSYSKTAYRLLKQFRTTGYAIFEIDKFLELFCIPSSYKQYHINQRVIQPIKNELSQYFKNLKINKISKSRGRKITHIEFIFDVEDDVVEGKIKILKSIIRKILMILQKKKLIKLIQNNLNLCLRDIRMMS